MAVASGWPRYVVLKSSHNNKYLRYVDDGPLQFSGDDVTSRFCKFELEMAQQTEDEGWFNIKCCHNNKYLLSDKDFDGLIKAAATEPNEDDSQHSCTLFQPSYLENGSGNVEITFRFAGTLAGLTTKSDDPDHRPLFGVEGGVEPAHILIDWESLVVMPKRFALKGSNGNYLGPFLDPEEVDDTGKLQFIYQDIGHPAVANAFEDAGDGTIFVKSAGVNLFWQWYEHSPDIDAFYAMDDDPATIRGQFRAIKVGDNTIALRSLLQDKLCGLNNELDDRLSPYMTSITRDAIFTVEEAVLSRQIYDVRFDLAHARIYNESGDQNVFSTDAANTGDVPDTMKLSHNYTKSTSRAWQGGVSLTLGVSATFIAGIPFIEEAEVTVSAEFEGSYSWGEEQTESVEIETTSTVIVPPRTNVTLTLLCTKGTCDVPFSYTQSDILTSGRQVITRVDSGVYTGINSYNYHYVATETPIE